MRSGIVHLLALSLIFVACAKTDNSSATPAPQPGVGDVAPPAAYDLPQQSATTFETQVPCCPNGGVLAFDGVRTACVENNSGFSVVLSGLFDSFINGGFWRADDSAEPRENRAERRNRRNNNANRGNNRRNNNGNADRGNNRRNADRRNNRRNNRGRIDDRRPRRDRGDRWDRGWVEDIVARVGFVWSNGQRALPASVCVAVVDRAAPCNIGTTGDMCSSIFTGRTAATSGGVQCFPSSGGNQGFCGQPTGIAQGVQQPYQQPAYQTQPGNYQYNGQPGYGQPGTIR